MAQRRGPNFQERFGLDTVEASANVANLVAGACLVYGVTVAMTSAVTGQFTLSDGTATADSSKDP